MYSYPGRSSLAITSSQREQTVSIKVTNKTQQIYWIVEAFSSLLVALEERIEESIRYPTSTGGRRVAGIFESVMTSCGQVTR